MGLYVETQSLRGIQGEVESYGWAPTHPECRTHYQMEGRPPVDKREAGKARRKASGKPAPPAPWCLTCSLQRHQETEARASESRGRGQVWGYKIT